MKLILRVDDAGRIPGDDPEYGTDHDLSYFASWRSQAGLAGLPVVYGVTHQWLHASGVLWLKNNIRYPEKLAVHGWDHKRGKESTPLEMATAMDTLTTDNAPYSYIPPYNAYTERTLHHWEGVGGKYFFGGFHGEHHHYGEEPIRPPATPNLIHLPANRVLYDHAPTILTNVTSQVGLRGLREYANYAAVVMTLHVPWDQDGYHVRDLVEFIVRHHQIISVDSLWGDIT